MRAVVRIEPTAAERDRRTIARIVKVNHAGEHGAIRIYRWQIGIAARRYPELARRLEAMLAHELQHSEAFAGAMPARNARPCRMMFLWSVGGAVLGGATALLGQQAIWRCTQAIEAAVHRHLDDQMIYLRERDPELHNIIAAIREEELSHLHEAETALGEDSKRSTLLGKLIAGTTEVLIWMSTSGDSIRMTREIRRSGHAP